LTLELSEADSCWRVQVTPLGGASILAAYWDITAQKAHERSLRASEQLNREILSGLQEGVVVVDTDTRVVVVNEAAAELFGVPVEEMMERPLSAIPVDLLDDRGHLVASDRLPLARALKGEEVTREVVRIVRRDGALLWIEVHARGLHDADGTLYGAVASYDDVTARVEQDRRTRHEADTDPLTGLANRRAFDEALDGALAVDPTRRAGPSAWSSWTSTTSRPSTTGSATTAATASCRRWPAGCGRACARTTSPSGSAARSSSWPCRVAPAGSASRRRPGSAARSATIPGTGSPPG
jgi:PAS domain S-box-containing protein